MRSVSIVGGGIAGLALAAALDPARFDVTVHEAQPARAGFGGALTLWPAAVRALARIGAKEAAIGDRRPLDGAAMHDLSSGRLLFNAGKAPFVLCPRPLLLTALRGAVPESVRFVEDEVADARDLPGDLVVGADGVRSVVRPLVHPRGAERRATPWVALRGSRADDLAPSDYGEYWGRAGLFGIVPVPDLGAYWFTSHPSTLGPEPLDVEEVLTETRSRWAHVAPIVRQILAEADPASTVATRLWSAPPLPRYVSGRYLVIGDAAHAMTPNLGRGANDAILDAVTLADALGAEASADRFGAWQARRVPATQAARVASSAVMRVALSGISTPVARVRRVIARG